jgi:hypothetical protein
VAEVLFDYRLRRDSMMRALPRSAQLAAPFRLALGHEDILRANLDTTFSLWGNRIVELMSKGRIEGRADLQPYINGLNEQLRAHVVELERLRGALKLAEESEHKAVAAFDELSNSTAVRMSRALRSLSPGLHGVAGRVARRVLPRK